MRKRTSAATNARNRSTKSGFIRKIREPPLFLRQAPGLEYSFAFANLPPEIEIVAVGVSRALVAGDAGTMAPCGSVRFHLFIIAHPNIIHALPTIDTPGRHPPRTVRDRLAARRGRHGRSLSRARPEA